MTLDAGAGPGMSYIGVVLTGAWVQGGGEIGACVLFRRSLRTASTGSQGSSALLGKVLGCPVGR